MKKQVEDHEKRECLELLGTKVLPATWSMKRKRRIATQEVYKWKARLDVHSGKQVEGNSLLGDILPRHHVVVNWYSNQLFLSIAVVNCWY